jgi:hypothetical protein
VFRRLLRNLLKEVRVGESECGLSPLNEVEALVGLLRFEVLSVYT